MVFVIYKIFYLPFCVCVLSRFSRVLLFETLWTVAHQAPLSMGFFRQEYWSGSPCPPPGDLPKPGIEPTVLMSAAPGENGYQLVKKRPVPNPCTT